jgi:hypothetical protein
LINGEFRINQRGYTSGSNLASGSYGFDRWKSTFTNTTLTFTSAPQGQIVTINSGGSVEQIIERENVSAGTYVLSWTGTATGRVYNTGATPPSYAASPIVVTLDGLANVEVEFTASGGTQTLWKPQLEQNYQPTPFEQRPIGVELALCQRYYQRVTANAGGNADCTFCTGLVFSTTTIIASYNFPTMRVPPTFTFSGGGYDVVVATAAIGVSGISAINTTTSTAQVSGTVSLGSAGGGALIRLDSGFFDMGSEL